LPVLFIFWLGQLAEGFMMLAATCIVSTISLYQDIRSTKALEALKQFTEPQVMVIRDGIEKNIQTLELLPGDMLVPSIQSVFGLITITFKDLLLCAGISFTAVIWFEIYKTNLYKPEQPVIRKKR
jgi:hypothetical protein